MEKNGPGLHHICLGVGDIETEINHLKEGSVRLINESPRPGAGGAKIAFVHPKSTGGVLLELSQRPEGDH